MKDRSDFVENFTMKITAQEEYGLRCVLRLAKAESGSITLPEVAAAEGLSVPYVAKLMAVLRHAGIVDSVRGRSGGYTLARPADAIGLGSLLLTLGEPLFDETDYCQKHAGTEAPGGICLNHSTCTLKSLWQTLEHWMRRTLDQITLADLLKHEGRLPELLRERLAAAVLAEEPQLISLGMTK
jgi:Rrf2 family transcriptional regulator, iron-sulfur cluster assembly transcription factor